MTRSNFCANCGARLPRTDWHSWLAARCDDCASRLGPRLLRPLIIVAVIAIAAFGLGRYLRPAPPPLIIHRAADSPLPDVPVNFGAISNGATLNTNRSPPLNSLADEEVYICGARTKKGTPCRRRVHAAGERCYQHKGLPAMVPVEKLTIKTK
jgi:hypothetical protein